MIPLPSSLIPIDGLQANAFDCISIPVEKETLSKNNAKLDYFVTEFPRNEDLEFSFVYGLFNREEIAFADNQAALLGMSNDLFENSTPLSPDEHNILMNAFKNSLKSTPTLPGRK